ncbi:TetR family transcriptional regulator [Citricoccus zhacaiensis]|uniref:TetR family transcriptional regulator n=1 Tax=Citricoccus zhacaiensis TaxID=489142 RepID=A0ABQ2LSL4_9MICC|nr:TetR/AcrR family transcriptional regulator [Citricoccus zhacaiensis]GGO42622.1 TetR family transcriptional regulator [Citricoccus zhacaiensis]
MARTAGRDAEDTKRLILEAAAQLIGRRGTAVPVSDIAAAAGVSKGGLLYHFPSKEQLLNGLASSLMSQFRREVEQAAAEEDEQTPGRLTRAYIRVCFADARDLIGLRDYLSLAARLMFEPGPEELARQDARRWRAALFDDGIDPATVRMIIAAADGSNIAPLLGPVLNDSDRSALEADLIALTYAPTSRAT